MSVPPTDADRAFQWKYRVPLPSAKRTTRDCLKVQLGGFRFLADPYPEFGLGELREEDSSEEPQIGLHRAVWLPDGQAPSHSPAFTR